MSTSTTTKPRCFTEKLQIRFRQAVPKRTVLHKRKILKIKEKKLQIFNKGSRKKCWEKWKSFGWEHFEAKFPPNFTGFLAEKRSNHKGPLPNCGVYEKKWKSWNLSIRNKNEILEVGFLPVFKTSQTKRFNGYNGEQCNLEAT